MSPTRHHATRIASTALTAAARASTSALRAAVGLLARLTPTGWACVSVIVVLFVIRQTQGA
ncbi:MAG: hypothetical protein AAF962_18940 [Actinomycetota bacterium]